MREEYSVQFAFLFSICFFRSIYTLCDQEERSKNLMRNWWIILTRQFLFWNRASIELDH